MDWLAEFRKANDAYVEVKAERDSARRERDEAIAARDQARAERGERFLARSVTLKTGTTAWELVDQSGPENSVLPGGVIHASVLDGAQEEVERYARLLNDPVQLLTALEDIAEEPCDELCGCGFDDPKDMCRSCMARTAIRNPR